MFRDCLLGDVLTLKRGYDLPSQSRIEGAIPVVSSSGFSGTHSVAKVKGPGVVTGRYGTIGEVHYVPGDFWPLNTTLYVQDFKGNDPRFISYFLQTLDLASRNAAAAVPGVNRNDLHRLPVRCPDIGRQRRIASILSAYDDLIENNARRIAILEEMARRIYEEWFVRLRFPGHEDVRMVESELGPVPMGWRFTALREVCAYINRGLAPKYDDAAPGIVINQKCIRDQRLSLVEARRQNKSVPQEKLVAVGDVLINSTGVGTLGRVAQVLEPLESCTVDTHVSIVRPSEEINRDFFGLALFSKQPDFEAMGVGSTGQTELSRGRIADAVLLLPPKALQDEFGVLVRDMRLLAVRLQAANRNVCATRDLLLPKLISGELDVSKLPVPQAIAA